MECQFINGGVQCAAGQPAQPTTQWCQTGAFNIAMTCGSTAEEVATMLATQANAMNGGYGYGGFNSSPTNFQNIDYRRSELQTPNCTTTSPTFKVCHLDRKIATYQNAGAWQYYTSFNIFATNTTQCPAYTDPFNPSRSIPAGAPVRPDGSCPGGLLAPKTEQELADMAQANMPKTSALPIAQEAIQNGFDLAPYAGPATLTGPAQVAGPVQSTTTPTGTTSQQTYYNITYEGDHYTFTQTTTQQNPDGTTQTQTGSPEIETCGLPGAPPCKIDEPNGENALSTAKEAVTKSETDAKAAITDAAKTEGKSTGWSFSFALPSGCSPITLFHGAVADPCQYQGMIHDIMAMLWAGSTAWLLVGMVGRTLREG
jgi:hypothetical protein